LSKPIDLRHSLARGYLFTGILYGATVLLTLVLCSFAVGSALATRAIEDRLRALEDGVVRTVASVASFEAEPSPSAWAAVRDLHALLQETARGAGLPPGGAATDLARLTAEVLAERFIRLGDAVSQVSLERLSSPGTPATDMGQAFRTLQRPAADYLRTLEQVGAETERALARAEDDRARFAGLLLALVAVVAVVGCIGGTVFLVGFARITTRDVRVLASFAAKVARGDYPDDKLPDRADGLGDLAAALRKVTRLEKALYDVRDLAASFDGRSRELDSQIGGTVARVTGQAARTEKAVRMLDDIVQAIQTVYTAARRSLETAEESGRDIDRSVATL
jgi:HAMP domain-containing protein